MEERASAVCLLVVLPRVKRAVTYGNELLRCGLAARSEGRARPRIGCSKRSGTKMPTTLALHR